MIAISLRVPGAEQDAVTAELWEAGTAGITENGEWLTAFFEDDSTASVLLERFREWRPEVHHEEERDWEAVSRDAWQPFAVGERFWLAPEWRDDPAPDERTRLTIHPGMACGTGAAPATQLCLRAMERWVRPGASLLDIGTGSGILADAARVLGAGPVVACDIEHEAAAIAQGNVAGLAVFTGSVRSVRSGRFDVVVANLNAAALGSIGPDLVRARKSDGIAILSGFRESEAARVAAAMKADPRDTLTDSDWACLVL
jgi:ribosomal protein L11 methyltransferase